MKWGYLLAHSGLIWSHTLHYLTWNIWQHFRRQRIEQPFLPPSAHNLCRKVFSPPLLGFPCSLSTHEAEAGKEEEDEEEEKEVEEKKEE